MPDSGIDLAGNSAELYRRPLAPVVKTLQTIGKTTGQPGMKGQPLIWPLLVQKMVAERPFFPEIGRPPPNCVKSMAWGCFLVGNRYHGAMEDRNRHTAAEPQIRSLADQGVAEVLFF